MMIHDNIIFDSFFQFKSIIFYWYEETLSKSGFHFLIDEIKSSFLDTEFDNDVFYTDKILSISSSEYVNIV